jgi:ring-1,2-phenylacetyl-CoA epoxidase subunit PaaE
MLALTVKKLVHETTDTRTYFVEELHGNKIKYQAGQFLTLLLNLNGRELRRSYSISSTPEVDEILSFTVKQIPNGEISRYLVRNLEVGSTLIALEPSGRFVYDSVNSRSDVFLIAAGSGITPVYSILKKMLHQDAGNHVKLIYQNKNEKETIFRQQLLELKNRKPYNFDYFDFLSNPLETDKPVQRLNNELLEQLILQHSSFESERSLFYICGPLSFMRMAEFTIRRMGYSSNQVRKEIFEAPKILSSSFSMDSAPRKIALKYKGKTRTIQVSFPQTILDAALFNHINIPFSCKAGICGTCAVKCSAGSVKMKINEVLTDDDLKNGLVLTCTAHPETDILLDLDAGV